MLGHRGVPPSYNDRLPPDELDQLYPLASVVVASRSTWRVRRRRTRRLHEWLPTTDALRATDLGPRLGARARIVAVAARAAADIDADLRAADVSDLVHELVAMGHGAWRGIEEHRLAAAVRSPRPRAGDPALPYHDMTGP